MLERVRALAGRSGANAAAAEFNDPDEVDDFTPFDLPERAPTPPGRHKRSAAARHAHSGSDGSSSSFDGSGHGVMRTEMADESGADDYPVPARSRRRITPPAADDDEQGAAQMYTHMTQSEIDQARLIAMEQGERHQQQPANQVRAPPPPQSAECPVCHERFESLYNEARGRASSGDGKGRGRENKARSAVQQTIINRYAVIFSIESTLRGYLSDRQLLPLLLQVHQATIEKPARENQIKYQPWTLEILQRHFDPADPHIFDPIRELRINQACARRTMLDMRSYVIVPDPDNPGQTMVNRTAVNGLNTLMSQNAKMVAAIAKYQTSADEGVSNAVFSLVSTVRRLGNLDGIDEGVLHDPTMAAGTMQAGGNATTATQTGSGALVTAAASIYKISGF